MCEELHRAGDLVNLKTGAQRVQNELEVEIIQTMRVVRRQITVTNDRRYRVELDLEPVPEAKSVQ